MFQTFASQMLERETVISALAFIPLVTHHGRGFSRHTPRWHDQLGPPLVERNASGSWITAGKRAEYFPVWHVSPSHYAELPPGWDVGSDAALKTALQQARDSGKMAAAVSRRGSEKASQPSAFEVYLFIPIFQEAAVLERIEERRARLIGFVCGVFSMDKLMQHALKDIPLSDVVFRIHDISPSNPTLIFSCEPTSPAASSASPAPLYHVASSLSFAETVKIADRQWKIECLAPPAFRVSPYGKASWTALGVGLLLTTLLMGRLIQKHRAEHDRFVYQQKLRTLALQLSGAEERERRRIATNLHDRVSQGLAAAMMKLTLLREQSHGQAMTNEIESLEKSLGQALDDSRSLTSELSPPVLYELGLEPAIEWAATQMRKRFGLETRVQWDGRPAPLDEQIRGVLFQATCELLTNVVKHAKSRTATVAIGRNGRKISISVKDNGVGFNVSTLHSSHEISDEFGLFNIRERLQHLGGSFRIESAPGQGAVATMVAPLKPDGPQDL